MTTDDRPQTTDHGRLRSGRKLLSNATTTIGAIGTGGGRSYLNPQFGE